jgi:hypothetical protein
MITSAFRAARVPLISYYVVTVLVPLANGSGNTGRAFLEHMAFVLLAPPTFVLMFALLAQIGRKAIQSFHAAARRPRSRSCARFQCDRSHDGHPSAPLASRSGVQRASPAPPPLTPIKPQPTRHVPFERHAHQTAEDAIGLERRLLYPGQRS